MLGGLSPHSIHPSEVIAKEFPGSPGLGLCVSTAGGMGLIPGLETKILNAMYNGQEKKKIIARHCAKPGSKMMTKSILCFLLTAQWSRWAGKREDLPVGTSRGHEESMPRWDSTLLSPFWFCPWPLCLAQSSVL